MAFFRHFPDGSVPPPGSGLLPPCPACPACGATAKCDAVGFDVAADESSSGCWAAKLNQWNDVEEGGCPKMCDRLG